MNRDTIHDFLALDTNDRLVALQSGEVDTAALARHFGEDAMADLWRLAKDLDRDHLSGGIAPNLIFIPGVMGSLLQSLGRGGVWWIDARSRGHLKDLRLAPNGDADADPGHDVQPFGVDLTYEPFLKAVGDTRDLRHRFFSYDWRKSLRTSGLRLKRFIEAAHATNGGKPFHLVAHSMGGLVIRAMLTWFLDEGLEKKIDRIVFIGTPHYGGTAIAGYLKNHLWGFDTLALLGLYLDRPALRSMRGVLSLLPAPVGIYPGTETPPVLRAAGTSQDYQHPCANFNLYRAPDWQLGLNEEEERQLQAVLDEARESHVALAAAHSKLDPDLQARMLMIAGVGVKTLFRLERTRSFSLNWKDLRKITDRTAGDPDRDGDGRVPLTSARLPGVTTRYVRGVHGGLTNMPSVYQATFAWVRGETSLGLPVSAAEALTEHLAGPAYSDAPSLDGSSLKAEDDPGYWNEEQDAENVERLRIDLEQQGDLPALNWVRIL